VLALTALILCQPVLRRALLDPLTEAVRSFRELASYASQDQQWRAALVALAGLLTFAVVRLAAKRSWSGRPLAPEPPEPMGQDPLADLLRLLDGADRSLLKRERIARLLGELLTRALATHRGLSIEEIRRRLLTGQAELDPTVCAVLYPDPMGTRPSHRASYRRQVEHVLSVIERLQQEV